jgi:hypothetical protein
MTTNIPSNTPLQQQIDEFIAEGASWLPTGLLWDLLRPIGQLTHIYRRWLVSGLQHRDCGSQYTPHSHLSKAYFSEVIAQNHLAYSSFNSFRYSLSNFCTLGSIMNVQ